MVPGYSMVSPEETALLTYIQGYFDDIGVISGDVCGSSSESPEKGIAKTVKSCLRVWWAFLRSNLIRRLSKEQLPKETTTLEKSESLRKILFPELPQVFAAQSTPWLLNFINLRDSSRLFSLDQHCSALTDKGIGSDGNRVRISRPMFPLQEIVLKRNITLRTCEGRHDSLFVRLRRQERR